MEDLARRIYGLIGIAALICIVCGKSLSPEYQFPFVVALSFVTAAAICIPIMQQTRPQDHEVQNQVEGERI